MTNNNDIDTSVDNEEVVESEDETEEETTETTESDAIANELRARLQRAESKIEKMKLDSKVEKKVEKFIEKKTGELDETQLDYLDLKDIREPEDIKVIENIIRRTGMSVREALKDEYVVSKLDANKEKREVKGATPSSTKRSGAGQVNDLALAITRFEQTGELPKDFALASQVTNAIIDKNNSNKPAWQ